MRGIKRLIYLIGIGFMAISFVACDNDDDNSLTLDDSTEKKNNTWIYNTMVSNYLWYEDLPDLSSLNIENNTEDFFNSLLCDKDGKDRENDSHLYFSYIEKKREQTKSISELDPTYGFEYIVYSITNQSGIPLGYYYARVLYVLPGSPAEEAGLQRNDWIYGVDGQEDNITDYGVLDGGEQSVFKIGIANVVTQRLEDKDDITMPAARIMENDPLLLNATYQVANRTVGYLVYNHFSSQAEGKTDGAYDTRMKEIFADFKSKGVNEFILDLRFNSGGLVTCANLLASLLAPANVLGNENFASLRYNDKNSRNNRDLKFNNSVASSNLNLSRLWVLTGQFTASSSEAVINSLMPFIDVRLIGDETVGKAVGSNPYGEDEDDYDWILHPITLRITNSQGTAAYGQVGFTPDVYIYEYTSSPFIHLYPLGDKNEKLLSIALGEISGDSGTATLRSDQSGSFSAFIPSASSLDRKKTSGLIVPLEE